MAFNRQQQHAPGRDRIELRDVCASRIGTQSYKVVYLRTVASTDCHAKERIGSLKRNR